MKAIYTQISRLFEEGRPSVLATIIKQAGPSPRGIGTKCLIMDDDSLMGTIGGGPLESRAVEEARMVRRKGLPSRLYFSLEGPDVAETDMLCGGRVEVFLEPVVPGDLTHLSIFQKAARIMDRGGAGLLATIIDQDRWRHEVTPKMFLEKGGETIGSLLEDQVIEHALFEKAGEMLNQKLPALLSLKDTQGEPVEVFVEPVVSKPVLYVFGGGHVSKQVVSLASRVGFQVVVIDDRADFAHPARFPEALKTCHLPFEGVMDQLSVDESSYLVIVTRGHMHDKNVLSQALGTRARYIGMIGSKRKREIIYQKLREEGFTDQDLSKVHSPIGLQIGAETPEEIAVSIVGELIKVRAGA